MDYIKSLSSDEVLSIHDTLNNIMDNELIKNFPKCKIRNCKSYEEGLLYLIYLNNIEKIIAVVPYSSNSIYTKNETFIIKTFTYSEKDNYFIADVINEDEDLESFLSINCIPIYKCNRLIDYFKM